MTQASRETAGPDVLRSWKEIAGYMSCGIRTAQRWESDLALPVRRPRGTRRSAVLAIRSEIDRWLKNCPLAVLHEEPMEGRRGECGDQERQARDAQSRAGLLIAKSQELQNGNLVEEPDSSGSTGKARAIDVPREPLASLLLNSRAHRAQLVCSGHNVRASLEQLMGTINTYEELVRTMVVLSGVRLKKTGG